MKGFAFIILIFFILMNNFWGYFYCHLFRKKLIREHFYTVSWLKKKKDTTIDDKIIGNFDFDFDFDYYYDDYDYAHDYDY
jgi:hypothetical protein